MDSVLLTDTAGVTTNGGSVPSPLPSPLTNTTSTFSRFHPGMAVTIGVVTTMFSITFLILLYAKHCRRSSVTSVNFSGYPPGSLSTSFSNNNNRRKSGVERAVVDSLPVFRFGSLQGEKEGLECAVCLNPFDVNEALRLLPKCRHAFHVECVDTWLESHSTCPLCRFRVDPEDILLFPRPPEPLPTETTNQVVNVGTEPKSSVEKIRAFGRRISGRHSSAEVAAAAAANRTKRPVHSRISVDFTTSTTLRPVHREPVSNRKDGSLLSEPEKNQERFEHRINIVATTERQVRERWSDISRPGDVLYVRPDMITMLPDNSHLSVTRNSTSVISNTRSLSEITGVSRRG